MLVERFAGYHRQSYGGCKVGVGDVLIGAAAVAADYNGAAKASHIKDKLIEMTHLNETLYADVYKRQRYLCAFTRKGSFTRAAVSSTGVRIV